MSANRRQRRAALAIQRRQPTTGTARVAFDSNHPTFVAYHEAGHAVAAVVLGIPMTSVDVKRRKLPDGSLSLGFTATAPVNAQEIAGRGEAVALPHMVQAFAGPLGEGLVNPLFLKTGADSHDRESVRRVSAVALCQATDMGNGRWTITSEEQKRKRDQVNALVDRAAEEARQLVNAHRDAIVRVAELLLERQELSGEEVAAIVGQ